MAFIVRPIHKKDLADLCELTKQFTLLNLPSDPVVLERMIDCSEKSFAGTLTKEETQYLFAIEDTEVGRVVATSLILGKHGSPEVPHYCFQILTKEHFSKDIGIGFKHNVLRFKEYIDGPTEIGGLLLDKAYRNRPEKLGKLISFSTISVYGKCFQSVFQEDVLV